ncbi:MAG: hypothetical protein B6D58_07880, partial [candidate division Zixibacteria bacterium 4484_95]
MKTLVLILILPTLLFAQVDYNLPEGLELVKVDGNLVTVRDIYTGIEDTYLIEGTPVINGWELEPQQDSLIFELVAILPMHLIADIQVYDFNQNDLIEIIGGDGIDDCALKILENQGNFNFTEVFRIDSSNIVYNLGDADRDSLIEVLTKWSRSIYLYEQQQAGSFPDSLVWAITPLESNFRVWPRISDLDSDCVMEVSFINNIDFNKIQIFENNGDNNFIEKPPISWQSPNGPGDFASGDIDGDGLNEVIGGGIYGILNVYETVADDSFELVWEDDIGHPNAFMHKFIGDTDSDGFGEWVSGSKDYSAGGFFFKVYEAVGDNQYEAIYFDSLPGQPWGLGGIAVGDIDGDGINEFAFSSNSNIGIYKYDDTYGWHRVWLLPDLGNYSVIPYLVDVDGNGLCEFVYVTDQSPGYTRIYA